MRRSRLVGLAVTIALLVGAGCGDSKESSTMAATTTAVTRTTTGTGTPSIAPPVASTPTTTAVSVPLSSVRIGLQQIATVAAPTDATTRTGSNLLWVTERAGRVRTIDPATGAVGAPIIDIGAETTTDGERGLLGLAFSPDGGLLYLSYTNLQGNSRVDEFAMNGDAVVTSTRRNVLALAQPASNHNGGHIAFGPDGYLWLGFGDGGGAGDQFRNGQNYQALLGSILRIDPRGRGAGTYSIPPDNPFVNGGGRPEIWMKGLRNPWRFSFDTANGDLWIADVGQGAIEEIDLLPAPGRGKGANLGWPLREGTKRYSGDPPTGAIDPIWDYDHTDGRCSVTGGYVYRGNAVPALRGTYLYGDYCQARLNGLRPGPGGVEHVDFGVTPEGGNLSTFAQTLDGEVYALSLKGGVFRIKAG
jgi:glucose/arabinose dehydrogenase